MHIEVHEGLCFSGDYVYWTDWHRRTVERVHKLTGKQRSTVVDQIPAVMGLTAVNMSALSGLSVAAVKKAKDTDNYFTCSSVTHYAIMHGDFFVCFFK